MYGSVTPNYHCITSFLMITIEPVVYKVVPIYIWYNMNCVHIKRHSWSQVDDGNDTMTIIVASPLSLYHSIILYTMSYVHCVLLFDHFLSLSLSALISPFLSSTPSCNFL